MNSEDFRKEAYRVSYAVFMIAEQIKKGPISEKIGKYAVLLLEDVFQTKRGEVLEDLGILKELIYFSSDTGFLSYEEREVLIGALDGLKDNFEKGFYERDKVEEFLNKDFDRPFILKEREEKRDNFQLESILEGKGEFKNEVIGSEFGNSEIRQDGSAIRNSESVILQGTSKRREEVLNKIKQSGICFLKDISSFFPNYSERTLRYDLEWLSKQGVVEKIGSSGPGTFYRAKI